MLAPLMKSGKIPALAVFATERTPLLPDVPKPPASPASIRPKSGPILLTLSLSRIAIWNSMLWRRFPYRRGMRL